ncbi:MAG: helix-turn-helix domain-containing protein [Pseudomonadota bacterium]
MSPAEIVDLLLRGGAAGASLILAAVLAPLAVRSMSARFGTLFALGAACYALGSAQPVAEALPAFVTVLKAPAMLTGVFFWWFALALFCDARRWTWAMFLPAAIIGLASILDIFNALPRLVGAGHIASEIINAALMVHVIVMIVTGRHDDLVEPRRKFRTIWGGAIALTVFSVALGELWKRTGELPDFMHLIAASAIFVVTCGIVVWSLSAQPDFFHESPARKPLSVAAGDEAIEAADRHLAGQLREAMAEGVYRTPGLTVGALADRLDAREHRLRAVINQQLGYRNFAAFLNEHRIEAARSALGDPAQARRQILQIALDLGYGSIAPFNRAFREITGATPTAYRRRALEDGAMATAAAE